jgi:hypothetical protein
MSPSPAATQMFFSTRLAMGMAITMRMTKEISWNLGNDKLSALNAEPALKHDPTCDVDGQQPIQQTLSSIQTKDRKKDKVR